jgi:hypothetical protein
MRAPLFAVGFLSAIACAIPVYAQKEMYDPASDALKALLQSIEGEKATRWGDQGIAGQESQKATTEQSLSDSMGQSEAGRSTAPVAPVAAPPDQSRARAAMASVLATSTDPAAAALRTDLAAGDQWAASLAVYQARLTQLEGINQQTLPLNQRLALQQECQVMRNTLLLHLIARESDSSLATSAAEGHKAQLLKDRQEQKELDGAVSHALR